MSVKPQGSAATLSLSLLTAVALFSGGGEGVRAGDKIEFSLPGNPVISQRPEREVKEDDEAPFRFDGKVGGINAGSMPAPNASITIILPAQDNNRNKLHAWESGANGRNDPTTLGFPDRNDFLGQDQKPSRNRGLTNDYDLRSQWDLDESVLRREDNNNGSGLAVQNPEGLSPNRGGASLWSGWQSSAGDYARSHQNNGNGYNSVASGIEQSPWSRTVETTDNSHDSWGRPQPQYGSGYEPGGPDVGGAGAMPGLTSSQAPTTSSFSERANRDGSEFGLSASESPWTSRGSRSALDAYGSAETRENPYQYNTSQSPRSQPQEVSRPAYGTEASISARLSAARPAVLTFPKKPGAILQ
ncbi:MAG TPA: hypothetical protein VHB20_17565 [Verrucomicrobiae bacterium]|jgi:hypothetical protein|nr:hypothetical protein [Verrucomicrobiae bacterium]